MAPRGSVLYVVSVIEDRVPSLKRTAKFLYKEEVPVERQSVIKNLPEALQMVKEMKLASDEWTGEYRDAARDTIGKVLKEQMEEQVAGHLAWAFQKGIPDRRNGSYLRHVLTELGNIILTIPRTRRFIPHGIIAAYAQRVREIDHLILAYFLLGLSTRKVGVALLSLLGERISAQTVSRVASTLDTAVRAFHRRRITGCFHALILDGIVIKRKTGTGSLARPVLVALGIRPDGRKEVIDFRLAKAESGAEWNRFLTDLVNRGLAEPVVICADGGEGLISILPAVYPAIPLQRCWAHKMRNILDKVPRKKQKAVKAGLQRSTEPRASRRPRSLRADGCGHGSRSTRRRSRAHRAILKICSPVTGLLIPTFARRSERPMPSSGGSGRYTGEHEPRACSATEPALRGSSMLYSCARI